MARILVCDDVRSICEMLDISLRKDGHKVETVTSGELAKRKLDGSIFDIIISDIKMPGIDGIEVLRHARKVVPDALVILITAVEDYEAAVSALNAGAYQYIHKGPGLVDEVKAAIQRAIETLELKRQNFALKRDAANRDSLDNLVGSSAAMQKLKQTVRTLAQTQSTVLVQGESGTGKELVARALHVCSPRAEHAFVSINCGAFPETLLESELFGHVRGAFTGATHNKPGLFEVASGGTIFLDEIGETTLTMQVKLLRVLQERTVRPVGGTQEIPIDTRVVAATNRDLDAMVEEKTFREDLYYRISVIPVTVPTLRDRVEDIPLLAAHFLKKFSGADGRSLIRISTDAVRVLQSYEWPGNVRQLENTIERAVALSTGDELQVELPAERAKTRAAAAGANGAGQTGSQPAIPQEGLDMERYVADLEKSMLQSALRQSNNVQTRAAEMLKLSYRSFRHLMKKYELS